MFSSIYNKLIFDIDYLQERLYSKAITYLDKIQHICKYSKKSIPIYFKYKINYNYTKYNKSIYSYIYVFNKLNRTSPVILNYSYKLHSLVFNKIFKIFIKGIRLLKKNLIYLSNNKKLILYIYKLFNSLISKGHNYNTISHFKTDKKLKISLKNIKFNIYSTKILNKAVIYEFIRTINKNSIKHMFYLKICKIYNINYTMYNLFILYSFIIEKYNKEKREYTYKVFDQLNKNSLISLFTNIEDKNSLTSPSLLYNFNNLIHKFIFGQSIILKKFTTYLSNFSKNSSNKPLGSFLLCGPSGSGKTEIVKLMTNYIYKSQYNLIQFDMSEYKEKHSLSRLIGSPPGYVGHEEGGNLINKINSLPNSIILFDEIEKANKDIFSIFLQILDEGILTDSKGMSCKFNKSIIFFTSNLGSSVFSSLGKKEEFNIKYYNKVRAEINNNFKLEFINRLNDIIIFNPLLPVYLYQLLDKYVIDSYNSKINISTVIKSLLSFISYSPSQGSRFFINNINRVINNLDSLKSNKILGINNFIKYVILN